MDRMQASTVLQVSLRGGQQAAVQQPQHTVRRKPVSSSSAAMTQVSLTIQRTEMAPTSNQWTAYVEMDPFNHRPDVNRVATLYSLQCCSDLAVWCLSSGPSEIGRKQGVRDWSPSSASIGQLRLSLCTASYPVCMLQGRLLSEDFSFVLSRAWTSPQSGGQRLSACPSTYSYTHLHREVWAANMAAPVNTKTQTCHA